MRELPKAMTPERWREIEDLYHAALEREPAARAALLSAADSEVRRKVELMLSQSGTLPALDDDITVQLEPGSQLGPYRIESRLGAGGMGDVFRCRDTRLDRIVAVKVTRERFSERFEREARAVAALNHLNICQLYDVGPNYLVMELIEGQTLAERISSGPVPLPEALHITRQIADALDAAHEKGIVHRDLKPANIKITPDGVVKVLDFGLAKMPERASSPAGAPEPSTLTMEAATRAGVILGTAAYMAPEQARGEPVDKRADIWAFGVVVYETATGRRLFKGDTLPDTLAAVLRVEPDWSKVPARFLPLLRRCLVKDPKRRLRDIGDARGFLEEPLEGSLENASVAARPKSSPKGFWIAWSVAALASLLAIAAIAILIVRYRAAASTAGVIRFAISLPEKVSFAPHGDFALSPDGRQLVFSASGADNVEHLWLRPLGSQDSRILPGTEEGAFPFWSPDSRFIAFSGEGKLKTFDIVNGAIKTICNVPEPFRFLGVQGLAWGGSWNRDGVIIFGTSRLMRVSENGGEPTPLTALDPSRQESVHAFPSFLPDGRHFFYTRVSEAAGKTGVYIGSTDSKPAEQDAKPLLIGSYSAVYIAPAGSGQVLFVRNGTLWSQPFDPGKLEFAGDPVPIAESVNSIGFVPSYGNDLFSVSSTGLLVYRPNINQNLQLIMFDRKGTVLGTIGEPGRIFGPRVSPNGKRLALTRFAAENSSKDIWIYDLEKGVSNKFTFNGSGRDAVWSPDGESIAYLSNFPGKYSIYRKPLSGSGSEELLFESPEPVVRGVNVLDWSQDGRDVLFQRLDPSGRESLWLVHANGDKQLTALPHNPEGEEFVARISNDMRWIAYQTNFTGKLEVYVQPFNRAPATQGPPASQWQVSNGAFGPLRWRKDGKELLYMDSNRGVMSLDLIPGPTFAQGSSQVLFRVPQGNNPANPGFYADATQDGTRFFFAEPVGAVAEFEVMLNWPSTLKK